MTNRGVSTPYQKSLFMSITKTKNLLAYNYDMNGSEL